MVFLKKKMKAFFFLGLVILVIFSVQQSIASSHHKPTDILQSVCVGKEGVTRAKHEENLASWKGCRFQREDLVAWVKIFFPNNTQGLTMGDCLKVRNHYLKGPELAVLESCETVFIRCDCDKDGIIDEDDLMNTGDYCLKDCNAANRLYYCIGDRMVDKSNPFGETKDPEKIDPELIKDS